MPEPIHIITGTPDIPDYLMQEYYSAQNQTKNDPIFQWPLGDFAWEQTLNRIPYSILKALKERDIFDLKRTHETTKIYQFEELCCFCFDNSNLNAMLSELQDLMQEDDDDEYGVLRPTSHALFQSVQIFFNISSRIQQDLPYGAISSDYSGGIRIEWYGRNKEVRLVIPSTNEQKPYIYYENESSYNIDNSISPESIVRWFNWLNAA